ASALALDRSRARTGAAAARRAARTGAAGARAIFFARGALLVAGGGVGGFGGAAAEDFVGAVAVDRFLVDASGGVGAHQGLAFGKQDRADMRVGRADLGARDRRRRALGVERRHQGLADAELLDFLGDVDILVGAERLRRRAHRLLVARGVGA